MQAMTYFAYLTPDEDGRILVRFYDVPQALTDGADVVEALANAADALSVALEGYLEQGWDFPGAAQIDPANAAVGHTIIEVAVPPALAARALLTRAMKAQGLSNVALATRLGRDEKAVRRILSGKGASLDLTLRALNAMGVRAALAA